MTMPVLTLLTPAAAPQQQITGRSALTDYSDGQQQSYSDDVAALLAVMETALVQLDSEMQQLAVETTAQPDPQQLVQSMLPQPLLFDPLVTADTTPSATGIQIFAETQLTAAEELAAAQPVLAAELIQQSSQADVVVQQSAQAAAATLTTRVQTSGWTGITTTPRPEATAFAVTALQSTELDSAEVKFEQQALAMVHKSAEPSPQTSSISRPVQPELLSSLLASQNKITAVQQLTAEITTAVTAVTQVQSATSQTLPVWQADPLPAQSQHWGQRLVQMLADKIDLQLGLNVNKAMIRLDPPSLGSIELSVQLDGDRLTVQMHSSNTQLREAMGQGLEQLRASLQQKLGADVQIELRMGSDSSSQQQQQNMAQQRPPQPDANFHSEPEGTAAETRQPNTLNLVNQLV
ncbi:flagellar hook-length control protein FliK [Rheinheimera mesophila]|uniref:Flagellar hook-length control protein FliK n=1 Tax=Rheinheimera mesophila TaxID=1547515 RepID=A0A3P3QGU0_9GAMM|nr:flagellar hook-length control protein FliK [Rheinheimera mesophila]RRJ20245.1 flagellar hook-length control protein FliK [Rheinheimera mesophila]